jgi:biofilm PGA synthesis N-glycosyltransferase PgaC
VRIVVIVPFLDEERHLPVFLESMLAQTRPPDELVLVDDGSHDGSYEIAARFARGHAGVRALARERRSSPGADRLLAAGEFCAFTETLATQVPPGWDVVAKMDADLRLVPELIARLEREFERDPQLGLAGSYLSEHDGNGRPRRVRIRPEHVHGATKFYRRECWEQIAPVPRILGWDMIDEVIASQRGWTTRSFAIPGGDPLHLRERGSHDGLLRGHRRWGMGAWAGGHSPLFVAVFCLREMRARPRVLGGLNYAAGYLQGAARRLPRADREVRAVTRRRQRRRLWRRLTGRAT